VAEKKFVLRPTTYRCPETSGVITWLAKWRARTRSTFHDTFDETWHEISDAVLKVKAQFVLIHFVTRMRACIESFSRGGVSTGERTAERYCAH
jgi:hypothetical protein